MQNDSAAEPALSAYIITHGRSAGVLIGDEFVRAFDGPSFGSSRLSTAGIEGRAMLAINARIFRMRSELVVFHAGAVAVGDRAAVIVGPTTSGKTTTSLALILSSPENRPLSDEFALINTSTDEVEAFPRLFSIRSGARKLLGLSSLDLNWETVDPAGTLALDWGKTARCSAFFFVVGRGRSARARQLPLSEAIFLAVGSEIQTTIDTNRLRVVDRVIKALSKSRLYAITLGAPQDTVELIGRLTTGAEAAVA